MASVPTHRVPSTSSEDIEHHPHKGADFDKNVFNANTLSQTQTGVTISPELFEKLYLTPKTPHIGDANKRFANPTPMGFVGFVISTFTFSMVTMGWGGADGLAGVAGIFFVSSASLVKRN